MAGRQWYTAIDGQQAGPYSDQHLSELIAAGHVRADTYVWCNGMKDWAPAGDIPGLMPRSRPAPPPPPRAAAAGQPRAARAAPRQAAASAAPRDAAPGEHDSERLSLDAPMWPLLGRALLVVIGQIFVIPAPWTATSFYRWFVDHTEVPGQQRVAFAGKPTDIWYIFMLNAACAYLGSVHHLLQLVGLLLAPLFLLLILQWFWRNLAWEGQNAPLKFSGDYLHMLGWYLLTAISAITIIGWAWVAAAWARWLCRHVEGAERRLIFTATGFELLWRTWAFVLSCIVIVPIPWTLHWYMRWLVSQFALTSAPLPAA